PGAGRRAVRPDAELPAGERVRGRRRHLGLHGRSGRGQQRRSHRLAQPRPGRYL
ncbi:uncharacterized protein METZ01_LOCUS67687, partial [marine metagenome]